MRAVTPRLTPASRAAGLSVLRPSCSASSIGIDRLAVISTPASNRDLLESRMTQFRAWRRPFRDQFAARSSVIARSAPLGSRRRRPSSSRSPRRSTPAARSRPHGSSACGSRTAGPWKRPSSASTPCATGSTIKRRGLTERSWREWEAGARPDRDYTDLLCRLFETGPVQLGFARDYTPRSCARSPSAPPPWTRSRSPRERPVSTRSRRRRASWAPVRWSGCAPR